jgi:hypothetical protein
MVSNFEFGIILIHKGWNFPLESLLFCLLVMLEDASIITSHHFLVGFFKQSCRELCADFLIFSCHKDLVVTTFSLTFFMFNLGSKAISQFLC